MRRSKDADPAQGERPRGRYVLSRDRKHGGSRTLPGTLTGDDLRRLASETPMYALPALQVLALSRILDVLHELLVLAERRT